MELYTADSPKFHGTINIVQTTDTNHADNINTAVKQIYENTLVLKTQAGTPDEFDPEKSYEAGSTVTHDGNIYKCTDAVEPGEWNEADWERLDNLYKVVEKLRKDTNLHYVDINLTTDGWQGGSAPFTQTVNSEMINENDMLLVRAPEALSGDALKAYNKAFNIVAQGTARTDRGSVTFSVLKKPETTIKVRLLMRGAEAAEAVPDPDAKALDAHDLSVTDTRGLLGTEQQKTTLQEMLNTLAEKVKALETQAGGVDAKIATAKADIEAKSYLGRGTIEGSLDELKTPGFYRGLTTTEGNPFSSYYFWLEVQDLGYEGYVL